MNLGILHHQNCSTFGGTCPQLRPGTVDALFLSSEILWLLLLKIVRSCERDIT